MKKHRVLIPAIIVLVVAFITIPFVVKEEREVEIIHDDLDQVIEDGELIVLTINSYASYLITGKYLWGFSMNWHRALRNHWVLN